MRPTRAVRTAHWADFTTWRQEHGHTAVPALPVTVVLYLSERAKMHKTATLQRRLTAISQTHTAAALDTPTADRAVRRVMIDIRRAKGTAQEGKTPAVTREIRAMVATLSDPARPTGPGLASPQLCRSLPAQQTRQPRRGRSHLE